ncbi:MAG: hypothetical protein H0T95_13635 [Chthoniobacterales bacterium]|nr:hypothetical protein [Chthoniobacterales bacterium]
MPAGSLPRAAFAAAIGLTINSTFILEACGLTSFAAWLRVGAIALYLAMGMTREGRTFLGNWLRVGLVMILAGFIAEALLPQVGVGALHIVFISGFGFIVITVAIRVVFRSRRIRTSVHTTAAVFHRRRSADSPCNDLPIRC